MYDYDLYTILNTYYPYIIAGMLKDDFYFIQDNVYDFFYEIKHDDKVVGFYVLNKYNNTLVLELIYILPEYRGNNLIYNEFNSMVELFNGLNIVLYLPNKFVILNLLKNDLAEKITNTIVKTKIGLTYDKKKVYYYYDLRLCAILNIKEFAISPLLSVDNDYFNAEQERNELFNDNYMQKVKECLLKKESTSFPVLR